LGLLNFKIFPFCSVHGNSEWLQKIIPPLNKATINDFYMNFLLILIENLKIWASCDGLIEQSNCKLTCQYHSISGDTLVWKLFTSKNMTI
jgi:hypothetical protein